MKYQSYIICTTPRSGSTLLCKMLAATGKSGNPGSHFHVPSLSGWLKSYDFNRADFASDKAAVSAVVDAARDRGMCDAGLFGLRLQRGSFDFFMGSLGILQPRLANDVERIEAVFGPTLFIHLTRQNKLDQAISRIIATQSGLWHRAADGTELERLSPPREPVYDADEIERNMVELTALDEGWENWFSQENISPLTLDYDDLSADPAQVLTVVLEKLELNRAIAKGITPSVARLANATNLNWAEQFLAERRNRQNG